MKKQQKVSGQRLKPKFGAVISGSRQLARMKQSVDGGRIRGDEEMKEMKEKMELMKVEKREEEKLKR